MIYSLYTSYNISNNTGTLDMMLVNAEDNDSDTVLRLIHDSFGQLAEANQQMYTVFCNLPTLIMNTPTSSFVKLDSVIRDTHKIVVKADTLISFIEKLAVYKGFYLVDMMYIVRDTIYTADIYSMEHVNLIGSARTDFRKLLIDSIV